MLEFFFKKADEMFEMFYKFDNRCHFIRHEPRPLNVDIFDG